MNTYVQKSSLGAAFADGDRIVEEGVGTFVTTGTTVELATSLSEITAAYLTPKTATYNANDRLSSDGVVASGAVTITRNAAGTSALEFYYRLVGIRYD